MLFLRCIWMFFEKSHKKYLGKNKKVKKSYPNSSRLDNLIFNSPQSV